jgi:hypothetical protein
MNATARHRDALKLWLRKRLTQGERPRQEWRTLWEATWEDLLARPMLDLVDDQATHELADRLADAELVTEISKPIVAAVAGVVITELREDEEPIVGFLPVEAKVKLHQAMARPGLVHPDWVRAMFRGEAAEAVLNDALYRALKDFSTLLPRLLMKASPMGRLGVLGSAGALAEKMVDELERRIEPEIKSFLAESTERVLERAAEFTITKIDDPASIEFRATFLEFMLSKSPAFFLEATDAQLIADMGAVAELTARHLADSPEMRAGIREWIERGLAYAAGKTVGEALHLEKTKARPPIDALANATWPAFITVVESPQAQEWLDTLVDELIDEYDRLSV